METAAGVEPTAPASAELCVRRDVLRFGWKPVWFVARLATWLQVLQSYEFYCWQALRQGEH